MNNEKKAQEILNCENCKKQLFIGGVKCPPACADYNDLMKMAEWKDEQLDSAIDKALQRNGDFLKQGKITQYGYDMAFVTIQNIREYLKQL